MSRPLLLALAVAAAALAADGAAARSTCAAKASRTLQQTSLVRVYRQSPPHSESLVYACSLRTGRRVFMGIPAGYDEDVEHIRIAGRRVAWWQTECGKEGCSINDVVVADLAGRRPRETRLHAWGGAVGDLVLTARGSVAWTYLVTNSNPYAWALRVADGAGVRDLAGDVEPGSLAGAGARIYWMERGEPRTATPVGAAAATRR